MSKIKRDHIRFNSIDAEAVYDIPKAKRNRKELSKITLSNTALQEVITWSSLDYNKRGEARFFSELILSQKGLFDENLFYTLVDRLKNVEALIHLMENMGNWSGSYIKWVEAMVSASPVKTMEAFTKNSFTLVGLDIKNAPFNIRILVHLNLYYSKTTSNDLTNDTTLKFIIELLGSMSEEERLQWYDQVTNSDLTDWIICNDPETPTSVFLKVSETKLSFFTLSNKKKIAAHKNCPESIQQKFYRETNDPSFIYGSARKFFFFPE